MKLIVKKSMRITYGGGDVLPEDSIVPSLEVTGDYSIATRLSKKLYEYQYVYRYKPSHFILSPEDYLSFCASMSRHMKGSLKDPISFEGVVIIPAVGEIGINLENLTHVVWNRTKEEEK